MAIVTSDFIKRAVKVCTEAGLTDKELLGHCIQAVILVELGE